MDRFSEILARAIYTLTSSWQSFLPANTRPLPDLTFRDWTVLRNSWTVRNGITVDVLLTLYPYLLQEHVRQALHQLETMGLVAQTSDSVYRIGETSSHYFANVEQALIQCAVTAMSLPLDSVSRLAVLSSTLVDALLAGLAPVPAPIFRLIIPTIVPSEHPAGQILQRFLALQAFLDDVHVASWRAEKYSPPAIQVASFIFRNSGVVARDLFLNSPFFFDREYLRSGLRELLTTNELIEVPEGYAFTRSGLDRREKIETQTNEYFQQLFKEQLSETGQKEWLTLTRNLAEGRKQTKALG